MELTITKRNGGAYIDSREVADFIGKRHDNLLRDIIGYIKILERNTALNFEVCNFFAESSYPDIRGRERLCFLVTREGCELIANKLIGEKGVLFTAAYVTRFHELEAAEREREIAAQNKPRLSEFNSAVRNVLAGMSYTYAAPQKVMSFLRGVYEPLGIDVLTDGGEYGYYSATEIARHLDIYSETGRPHGHAVAAIISKLDFPLGRHTAVVPYGLVGVSLRYDISVLNAVFEWLRENRFPGEVPYLDFDYHIYYHRQAFLFDTDNDDDWFGDEE